MILESFRSWKKDLRQISSYALIGVLSNLAGYVLYLLLTYSIGTPKLTMTALYSVAALISFFANRRFTFQHNGRIGVTGVRYLLAQLFGYFLNLLLLFLFVDCLGFAHQYIQAIAVFVVAIFLFILLRVFVFVPHQPKKKGI